ncbi:MAG: hypothetical protein LAP38_07285 [Acidobacteriia bacterium]|nr:hypothetical protein [Terriglobia bacterium]
MIAEPLGLFRIFGAAETLGEFEEFLLLALLGLYSVLNELHQHPVGTEPAVPSPSCERAGDGPWQGNALPNDLI